MARDLSAPDSEPLVAAMTEGVSVVGTVLGSSSRTVKGRDNTPDKLLAGYDVYVGAPLTMITCQVWDSYPDESLLHRRVAFRVVGVRTYNDRPQLTVEVLGVIP